VTSGMAPLGTTDSAVTGETKIGSDCAVAADPRETR
jgi:hypothetical protein